MYTVNENGKNVLEGLELYVPEREEREKEPVIGTRRKSCQA